MNWKQAGGTLDSEVAHNQEIVDDSDTGKVTYRADRWPASTNTTYLQYAYKKTYRANKGDAAGDTFTWIPHLTEDGEYQVEAHYVPASDRTTVPYTIHYKGGKKTVNVNQATGSGGVWTPLGSHPFTAGTSHQIVLGDSSDPSKASIADAIRLTKYARAVKKANTNHEWHYYSVRNLAQRWVNDPSKNFGMLLKAKDEGKLGQGGPRYYASERYDETNIRPKLVVTYGDPGVTLEKPTKIYATGAELNWSKYTGSDFVEYQVHRSVNQDFQPSPSTLVAPLQDPNTVTYTDTTAEPTPLDESGTEGKAYYYQVVVKTKKEELRSNSVITRLPKAGRTKQIIRGAKDTTLASAKPDTNLNTYNDGDKDPWLQVGWSATYGKTRPVLKFDLSGIPSNADIVDADLDLWQWSVNGDGPGDVDVHALNRSFTEKEATWNRASSATAWSKAGGDYDSTVIDTIRGANLTNDLHWRTWNVDSIVQDWVSGAKENYGFLIKPRTEGTGSNALFLSSESGDADHPAGEALMRPRMEITYIEPTAANTYYIPQTPARMISGEEYTVGVTLTNTTKKTWKAADHALSYHWKRPDDSEVTTGGNPVKTPLSKDLAPGESVTLKAKVKTPNQSDAGNKREAYVLDWDIQNTTDHTWLSETDEVETLDQKVTLEEPTSDQLGLEKFYQYAGKNTGAGSTVMVNQYAGNVVFGYNPFSNPSRGLATFLRMTYNSLDTSDSAMGYGWSLSATSLMRLGSALDLHPKGQEFPREVTLTDGDGTSHIFKLQKPDDKDPATWYYQKPAGVHFYLQKDGSKKERQWVMTRPDRTQFYFDEAGFLSAIVDKTETNCSSPTKRRNPATNRPNS